MRRIASSITAALFAVGIAVSAPAIANAGTEQMYWTGGSLADCQAVQRTYISSWTKITESCHRNGNGYSFTWASI